MIALPLSKNSPANAGNATKARASECHSCVGSSGSLRGSSEMRGRNGLSVAVRENYQHC